MNQTILVLGLAIFAPVLFIILGWAIGQRVRRSQEASRTLLIGIDNSRGDVELRWVKVKDNRLVWGTEKGRNVTHDGIVQPGDGSSFTLNGAGRAFVVNRQTLRTFKISTGKDELETAPEDGWQVGMYAVGVHERNIARPSGGTWLDTLAGYTPILVIVIGVVMVIGLAMLKGGV